MHDAHSTRTVRPWLRWTLITSAWLLFGFVNASQNMLYAAFSGRPATWGSALRFPMTGVVLWALLTPAVLWAARRVPLEPGRWLRGVLTHLALGAAFTLVHVGATTLILMQAGAFAGTDWSASRMFVAMLIGGFHTGLFTYAAVIGLHFAFEHYRKNRERQLTVSQLETRLEQARLQSLKMQLQPHFLFNTLNAISSLMQRDVEAADRMLVRLSDLLRVALDGSGAQEVPLRRELDFLRRYLEIESIRFEGRLAVHFDIAPEALDAAVPNLVLQPLVENAIKHGIAPYAEPGRVDIEARTRDDSLELRVRDSGRGPSRPAGGAGAATGGNGVGLSNTRSRLQLLYGARQRLDMSNGAEGGCEVLVSIPFRVLDEAEAG